MKVVFWGTRGSLPSTFTKDHLHVHLHDCLQYALDPNTGIKQGQSINDYLNQMPRHITHTYGVNTSCVEIESNHENEYILCDAGTGIRDFGMVYARCGKLSKPACFHLFLTHLHWDHIQGLPFFVPLYVPGNKIIVHGHHHNIEEYLHQQMHPPCFPVPLKAVGAQLTFDIKQPWEPFEVCGFKIQSLQQNHPGISFGYRFEKDDKVVVYSTDCEHTEMAHENGYPFIEFFKNADVLIFDAMYSLADATIMKVNWGHSNNFMGIKLAAKAHVKHLFLFHHEPTSDDKALEQFLLDTITYEQLYHKERKSKPNDRFPTNISLASDGLVLDV
ncbi:MAG: MBL fold metallo-hydrolase [Puniceicoccales bacterium]|jgi:phosphoribosyl 1,2-cyclic phosphodiesterase|nr:MBL fold metallo-hydrolase [Puniceicoccales bacterium]